VSDATVERPDVAAARAALAQVCDPEIPVLTIEDLGVLRDVEVAGDAVTVTITPTYSGCPAMTTIEIDIRDRLLRAGFARVEVKTVLAPAWTTDWLSEAAREKLRGIGIAPPAKAAGKQALFGGAAEVACPQCGSTDTGMLSEFGSTACKALYRCNACGEPFDYFKCI
jgi:ring-1,2-phenylacetyl-CoA epoxidase subunit PaaD